MDAHGSSGSGKMTKVNEKYVGMVTTTHHDSNKRTK